LNEEVIEREVRAYFERIEAGRRRLTRYQLALLVLVLVNLGLDVVRLRQDRLCFSRDDVVAVAAGVAKGMAGRALREGVR